MNYYEPADILIYVEDKGIVLREKSLMALDAATGKILAFGTEAERMAEKPEDHVKIASPLRRGMVADYTIAVKLFLCLFKKAGEVKPFRKPAIAVSVPEGITEVEKKAMEEALYQIGAGKVLVFEMGMEQLIEKLHQSDDKSLKKFRIVMGIVVNDMEK